MNLIADHVFRIKRVVRGRYASRRSLVYCVGTAKSGTHSICSMFSRNVRAGHEPQAVPLIKAFFDWQEGRMDDRALRAWLHERDRAMALEVDSSWFNILVLDFLPQEFPDARFILTIRDAYSWLNSEFKRVLHQPSAEPQRVKLRNFIYGSAGDHYAPEEESLKALGLHPMDGYLSRWAAHNQKVLDVIPAERLLVVRTEQIRPRAQEIADFSRLPRHSLRLEQTHEYRNPNQRQIIKELDRDFLERKISQHCRPLMERFFPEIKTLDDLKL